MCPAAMKCVPSDVCDFKGVMVEKPINYTPDLLMLRVQLNTCVNPDNQNIDVCCRDPNYQDPWPNMNGGGGGGGGGNQGRNQFSGGNQNQGGGNQNQFSGGNQGQQHPVQQQPNPGFGGNAAIQPRNGGGGGSRGGYGK